MEHAADDRTPRPILPEETTVVIDEIQRLPILLNEVHRLIERPCKGGV